MNAYLTALLLAGGAALGLVVWVLAKLGKALIKIAEALAAAAVVIFAVWLVIKTVGWALAERQRWKAEYAAAQLAASGSPSNKNSSATDDQAA